jgi:hypothetical protein
MNARTWISLLAAAALLAACGQPEDSVETTGNPAKTGDQSTTPGGVAGESAAQPNQASPDAADDPPATAPPPEPATGT